jgi:hypothetical protein
MRPFFVFLVFICPFLAAEELSGCDLCTKVVSIFEQKNTALVGTKDDWIKELRATSEEICFAKLQVFATPLQCTSFFELNAAYIVDLMLEEAKPDSICKTIGSCSNVEDSNYKLIFPIIMEKQITYEIEEKEISQDSYFHYKLFLGNPSFLHNDSYHLVIELQHPKDSDLNLKVTNKTTFVQSENCNDKNCSMDISKPGRGVWYYFTIHVKVGATNTSFFLNATEKNETVGHWIYVSHSRFNGQRFAFILCFTFSTLCLLCWCISRCIFSKRRYKHQQRYVPVVMQPIPETFIPMDSLHSFEMFSSRPYDPDSSTILVMYPPQPIANADFAEQQ